MHKYFVYKINTYTRFLAQKCSSRAVNHFRTHRHRHLSPTNFLVVIIISSHRQKFTHYTCFLYLYMQATCKKSNYLLVEGQSKNLKWTPYRITFLWISRCFTHIRIYAYYTQETVESFITSWISCSWNEQGYYFPISFFFSFSAFSFLSLRKLSLPVMFYVLVYLILCQKTCLTPCRCHIARRKANKIMFPLCWGNLDFWWRNLKQNRNP